ncbi:MAG: 2-oxoglutarate/2-oxoacid ferredoxin oxidoreductase subunit alpha [Thermoanaerobaculia bacterium]|jgi:2-oxoglutarate ferredoxin oxidoreductase subunit alpha|nr:2-oxoglutarate/2-oxoacid ferredoxin oxidoreductase subunit alpha [Thermoanaerobaculia bacterium]
MHDLTFAFVGAGGDGAVTAGDIMAGVCASEGLHVIKTEAYGPQIRGGESSATVRVSSEPVYAQADVVDVLVVFSWADFARFQNEVLLAPDAVIFHESADAPPEEMSTRTCHAIPFANLAREAGAPGSKNVIAVGLLTARYGLPLEVTRHAISRRFAKKAATVIEANLRAFDRGVMQEETLPRDNERLEYAAAAPKLLMSGNEAAAFAAIHAGCRFFAGYPITPSTEILHFMSEWLPKIGGSSLQTEDELSAIGAVIGASFTGAKAMTATSGPGLSLMAELLGLSSIAEVPAVIINVQRGGPSTGIPTKSEQSDLFHAVYASHGDAPRVVIACSDVESSFHATVDAFNIAEEYQVPVIVLSDQSIAQRRETITAGVLEHEVRERRMAMPDDLHEYRRYRDTADGVSPMTVPGMCGGMYQTNGLEHDEQGRPNSSFVVHEAMNAKRYRKLDAIADAYRLFDRFGAARPEVGVLCWGSSTGIVREAIARMGVEDRVGVFAPIMIAPLPVRDLQAFIDSCASLLVVEVSYAAQFTQHLRTQVDLPRARTTVHSRSGGKNLAASEVEAELRKLLTNVSLEVLA